MRHSRKAQRWSVSLRIGFASACSIVLLAVSGCSDQGNGPIEKETPIAAGSKSLARVWQARMDDGHAALKQESRDLAAQAFAEAVRLAAGFDRQDPRRKLSHDSLATARWDASMHAGVVASKERAHARAEQAFSAAVSFAEEIGPDNRALDNALSALAAISSETGDHARAESLLRRALAIRRQTREAGDPDLAQALNQLGFACRMQGKYAEAEAHYREALKIAQASPAARREIGVIISNLGIVLNYMGTLGEAEALFEQSVEILATAVGPEDPVLGMGLHTLAGAHMHRKRYAEAKSAYLRSIAIAEKAFGAEHENVAHSLNNISYVLLELGNREEALRVLRRALAIREKTLGADHHLVGLSLYNLAAVLSQSGQHKEAEPLLARSLAIQEKQYGPESPQVANTLEEYARVLRATKRIAEAKRLEARAKAISTKL